MKVLVSEKLSEHKYKTPEGYLICTDAILARTGKQTYTKDELFCDGDNTEVNVDRPYNEVMNAKTIASFENKPITFDHPDEDVNVGNYKSYSVGYVRDVRQGKTDKGEDVILGNLVITDQDAINAIEQGDHTDLSCGYDCDIRDDGNGNYSQTNIRGNHLALCEQGRAGIAHIVDSKVKDDETIDYKGIKIGVLHTSIGTLYEVRYNKNKADWPEYKKLENAKKYIDIFLTKGEQAANASWKIDDTIVDNKIKDSLSKKEKELCDYMLENALDDGEDENDLLKKMKVYYYEYSNLARSKSDEVLQYFKSRINDNKIEDAITTYYKYKFEYDTYYHDWKTREEGFEHHVKVSNGRNAYEAAINAGLDKSDEIVRVYKEGKLLKSFTSRHLGEYHGRGNIEMLKNIVEDSKEMSYLDSKVEDAEYTYKLTKKKNDYDEYVIQAYKNGKKNEDATYYTDDWDDAINTLKSIAKQEKLTFRQQGSVFIADNKAKVFNDSKESMTTLDALKMIDLIKKVSK